MCIENKINIYTSFRNESEKFVNSLSDVDWYGAKSDIEERIRETEAIKRVDLLNCFIENLQLEREWITMSEWNEKLSDTLRFLRRFLLKSKKDYKIVEECENNLDLITMVEF